MDNPKPTETSRARRGRLRPRRRRRDHGPDTKESRRGASAESGPPLLRKRRSLRRGTSGILQSSHIRPAALPGRSRTGRTEGKIRACPKLMRPFFPVIRFFGLPLHQDIRATQKSLHETNKRLDKLYALFHLHEVKVDRRFHATSRTRRKRLPSGSTKPNSDWTFSRGASRTWTRAWSTSGCCITWTITWSSS